MDALNVREGQDRHQGGLHVPFHEAGRRESGSPLIGCRRAYASRTWTPSNAACDATALEDGRRGLGGHLSGHHTRSMAGGTTDAKLALGGAHARDHGLGRAADGFPPAPCPSAPPRPMAPQVRRTCAVEDAWGSANLLHAVTRLPDPTTGGARPRSRNMRTESGPDSEYTRTWSPNGRLEYATLGDGSRLRYLRTGVGRSQLVLLHTVRTQLDHFQLVTPKIGHAFTVYAIDLPGMGWSNIRRDASYTEPAL